MAERALHTGEGSTPIPDPTLLTTQQLIREIDALKELIFTRLSAMDRATELLAADVHRVPTDVTSQVAHLKELVFTRFSERDLRTAQYSTDTKEALAAARNSAASAIIEAKEALNKRFDIADAQARGLDERVRMLMPRSESEALHKSHEARLSQVIDRLNGREERGKGMGQFAGWIVAAAGLIATMITIVFAVTRSV